MKEYGLVPMVAEDEPNTQAFSKPCFTSYLGTLGKTISRAKLKFKTRLHSRWADDVKEWGEAEANVIEMTANVHISMGELN